MTVHDWTCSDCRRIARVYELAKGALYGQSLGRQGPSFMYYLVAARVKVVVT